jgi:beta-lactamase regulating signal transducer with metallopeptidase domain
MVWLFPLYAMILLTFGVLIDRFIAAALVVSLLVLLLSLIRKKLSSGLRSWLWGICFLCLLLPFERASLLLFGDAQIAVWHFRRNTIQALQTYIPFVNNLLIALIVALLYLAGLVFFAVRFTAEQRKTYRMIQRGALSGWASYFHKGRSRIYIPPDFETAYTEEEQAMLLAHERQHIAQHDPFLYRLLAVLQCIFWFCPLVHKGVRLFKQDRELLCDERVMKNFSKSDYGLLLLKEAQAHRIRNAAVGMLSAGSNASERIGACIVPIRDNKKAVLAALCTVAAFLALAIIGFPPAMKDVSETGLAGIFPPVEVNVSSATISRHRIESLESGIQVQKNGISFDQMELYNHALSIGLSPSDTIDVTYIYNIRPSWSGYYVNTQNVVFTVADIQNQSFIPFTSLTRVDAFFEFIYWLL